MSTSSTLRTDIVRYVTWFHGKNGSVPTVDGILTEFKLNRTNFYKLFPGKVTELCTEAGVPVPEARIQAVKQALEGRSVSRQKQVSESHRTSAPCLTLSPEQTRRIYGIGQLEGGLDPSAVVDQLLNTDTKLRRTYHLSLSKIKTVSDFLDAAVKVGWNPGWIVEYVTRLWNLRITNLTEPVLKNLIALAERIDMRFWGSMQNFVEYAMKYDQKIGYFKSYCTGSVSLQQLLQAEGIQ